MVWMVSSDSPSDGVGTGPPWPLAVRSLEPFAGYLQISHRCPRGWPSTFGPIMNGQAACPPLDVTWISGTVARTSPKGQGSFSFLLRGRAPLPSVTANRRRLEATRRWLEAPCRRLEATRRRLEATRRRLEANRRQL